MNKTKQEHRPTKFSTRLRVALLAAGAGFASVAAAQSPVTAANATDQTSGGLEEIIVTAQRRAEDLQKVAISASVFDGKQLKERGMIGIQDLQAQTPSLSIQPAASSETFINIRGVGIQQTSPTSSNGVAFYIDGQYIPSLIDTVDTFYDLANVEVLRGPQGTLVGSNSDGGAIFVNSVQPSFDKVKGYFQQTLGNFDDRRSEGAINLPLSDMFAARAAFVYETRNSFSVNQGQIPAPPILPSDQNQPGNVDYESVRLQLTFRPNDDFQATLRYEPYQSRTDGYALKPDMNSVAPGSIYYDPHAAAIQNQAFLIDYNVNQYTNITGERTGLTGMWHVTDGFEIKSITSYQDGYLSDLTDIDGSSAPANIYLVRRADFETFTQELNVLSTSASPFQWVAGAYYLHTNQPLILTFVNFTNPPVHVDAKHENEAVFASGTYTFTPQWSATVGGRYSWDSLPYTEILPPVGTTPLTESKPTGNAKLNFQVTPETLIYASVSTGYKAGGVNLQLPGLFTPPPADPETNVVEELGIKTTVFDNHLRLDADVFNSKYSHYQLQEANPEGFPLTQGPGDAKIYGFETEVTGAFNELQFNFGASYLHSGVSSDFAYSLPSGDLTTITEGTEVPFAPKWLLSAGIQYTVHLPVGSLTPRLQYHYQSQQYTKITNQIAFQGADIDDVLPSYSTADFRLTYAYSENWDVEAYVTNLANKTYANEINPSPIGVTATVYNYGAPRQFGGRFLYKF
jgi:iron complex outermembrane recepter protein